MTSFVYATGPARVLFGPGQVGQLPAELDRLGLTRVLVVHGPSQAGVVDRIAGPLGARLAARFDGVTMHTPVEVTARALVAAEVAGVDGLVSIGGGSATGLGKALAGRTGLPLIAVPTTYAGSEVTAVLGETAAGAKTTRTDPAARPRTVVYDVELTLDLPVALSVASGVNALAHAIEALYSPDANPLTDQTALESIRRLAHALPRVVERPSDVDARTGALVGAWLAGTCLGTVAMGLHHKVCHTLGGTFGLPHAETHTVVLPHVLAYNAPAAPAVMTRVAAALGRPDAATGVYDLVTALGGPTSLAALGFAAADVDRAAGLATAAPYPNPRPVTAVGVAEVLRAARAGTRPTAPR